MKLSKAHQQQVANDFMVFINAEGSTMTTLKMAILINDQGCHFDKIELSSMKKIKEWGKGRGSASYVLDVDSVYNIMNGLDESVRFAVKNNRFYKIKEPIC